MDTVHYTLYSDQYSGQCTLYTVHWPIQCTLYTLHCTVTHRVNIVNYTLYINPYSAHCTVTNTVHTLHSTLYKDPYKAQSTLFTVQWPIQCTHYTLHCTGTHTVHTVHYTLYSDPYSAHRTLYTIQWPIQCTLYTWHCTRTQTVHTLHSPLYLSLPLYIYPAENIQTSVGDHPSNIRECQTPHHRPVQIYFQLFLATLTESGQWNSSPSSSELHSPLSVRITQSSWKHRLRWPVVQSFSHSTICTVKCTVNSAHSTPTLPAVRWQVFDVNWNM